MGAPVVVLAGGTGGAKLARGLLDVCGDDLVAIVNTGDDVEMYGAYVSPDPDLVTFWLADRIDERGWGLRDDTFHAMDQLRELGVDVWFNLGDRDLAIGLHRAERLRAGATLTTAISRSACTARSACAPARRSRPRSPSSARRSASARACCRWPTGRSARASSRAAPGTTSRPS
jgi:2-phospho-L-lactate transferase